MTTIPVSLTEAPCIPFIEPHLTKAKRRYVSKIPLYQIFHDVLYVLHTGCQWQEIPIKRDTHDQPEMSWQVPRYHFYTWSKDGSLDRLCDAGILHLHYQLHVSVLNLDGSHRAAKKGAKMSPIKAAKRRKPAIVSP